MAMTEVFLDQENRRGRSVANLPKNALLRFPFPQEIAKKPAGGKAAQTLGIIGQTMTVSEIIPAAWFTL
jgi:hypothetical protein